jgi:hypothetical protein
VKPRKGPNADSTLGRDAVDDDERYESWRHPTVDEPTPSRLDFLDRGAVSGAPQYGGSRGVAGAESLRRQDEPGTPTRVVDDPAAPLDPGARRYRRSGNGFRVAPGPATGDAARRPDPRIREDVLDILVDDAFVDASEIEVKVDHGEVELCGHVCRDHERRRANELAARVAGVVHVVDHLTVGGPSGA